jgi:transcription antitermination factor NusG
MQSVDLQRHAMRAAFTRGSARGWVYVETTMTPTFQHHLSLIPGVIRSNRGPIKFPIDAPDRIGVITLPKLVEDRFEVGHWARVLRGPYKDDIGIVDSVQTWGVSLLLIPRLPPAWDDPKPTTHRKRKRRQHTPRPPPALFNAFHFVASRGASFATRPHEEPRFTIGSLRFECGLLRKDFDYHTISSHVVFLPTSLASAFHESGHPTVKNATFPPPHEWEFYEGELVTCLGTSHQEEIGTVRVVGRDFLTVSFVTGDTIDIPWANARKEHLSGDFVRISNGPHQGRLGWVVDIDGFELCCAEEVLQSPEFKTITVEVRFQQFEGFIYSSYYCL